jgi:DNA polymerase-3 subunit epsilon
MDFVALDFETANADLSSICQVGLVVFRNGEVAETFSSLVDPNDYFDPINSSIHGLTDASVRGAPTLVELDSEIRGRIHGNVVACHSLFDRAALLRASERYKLDPVTCHWLDTIRVVRRTWPQYARSGYGLANLTRDFDIAFQHHDASEDARATGLILVKALRESGTTLDEWLVRSQQPLPPEGGTKIVRDGAADGALFSEVVVFTGALSMPRREAADLAAKAGCAVEANVTKDTTLLIVGDQDVTRLAPGQEKSSKHVKAEALIAKGQSIRILRETDFLQLVAG